MKSKQYVKNNTEYQEIYTFLDTNEKDGITKQKAYRLKKKCERFVIVNGLLYHIDDDGNRQEVVVGTDIERMRIIAKNYHCISHVGVNKLEALLSKLYFYISREVIRNVVKECYICSQAQPLKTHDTMVHITASKPNERFQMDLVDMRLYAQENNNISWLLVVLDVFSKFSMCAELENKKADTIVNALKKVFQRFGPPTILQSDNGKEFKNAAVESLCSDFKIKQKFSRPRHPQSQGQVERLNQTLCRWMQKNLLESNTKCWTKVLDKVVYSYNITIHSATKKSPFEKYFNRLGFNTHVAEENESANNQTQHDNLIANNSNQVSNSPDINKNDESNMQAPNIPIQKQYDHIQKNNEKHYTKNINNLIASEILLQNFDNQVCFLQNDDNYQIIINSVQTINDLEYENSNLNAKKQEEVGCNVNSIDKNVKISNIAAINETDVQINKTRTLKKKKQNIVENDSDSILKEFESACDEMNRILETENAFRDEINLNCNFKDENIIYTNVKVPIEKDKGIQDLQNTAYFARMLRNSSVHESRYSFKVGDRIIVKKDFDNNQKTKKQKLDSFYSKPGVIVEILSSNRAKIQIDDVVSIVKLNQIIKI